MANPPSADTLVAALRAEGLTVIEWGDWRNHNRNSKGAFGPIHGVMLHHTVSRGEISSVNLCYDGYSELPGPLCQAVIPKSGVVYMVGHGRCNHAGGGDPNVLQAVIDERYNDRPPVPRVGNATGVDGNARFIGAECVNMGDGIDPWPPAQVEAMVRFSAAICRMNGWTEKSTIAHREWSSDKSDPQGPGMPTMPVMRARIKDRLARPATWNSSPTTPAETGTVMTKPNRSLLRRTEDMTLIENVPQAVYWTTEYPDDANGHADGGKTVATNVVYDGVVNLRLAGLGEGEYVEVYAAEEYSDGTLKGESEIRSQVRGVSEGQYPLQVSVPVSGHVADRLSFRIVSRAPSVVFVEEAWLSIHSWPLS
jgi:hypothetical protein